MPSGVVGKVHSAQIRLHVVSVVTGIDVELHGGCRSAGSPKMQECMGSRHSASSSKGRAVVSAADGGMAAPPVPNRTPERAGTEEGLAEGHGFACKLLIGIWQAQRAAPPDGDV